MDLLVPREARAKKALDRLGTVRWLAFFQAVRTEEHRPLAVKLLHDHLDRGKALEAIFVHDEPEGFFFRVKGRGRRFQIEFGWAGENVGDGGTWDVEFDRQGRVVTVENREVWIS